jgi:Domain of unknown function (DUF4402)
MSRFVRPLCGTLALTLFATPVAAQSATLNATATVQQGLAPSKLQDLQFGSVFPGVDKIVQPSEASSGRFRIGGQPNAGVRFSVEVTSTLVRVGGSETMAIAWTGCHSQTNPAGTCSTFVLAEPGAFEVGGTLSGLGELFVFLGGTLTVPVGQVQGEYTSLVTLSVAYTGT